MFLLIFPSVTVHPIPSIPWPGPCLSSAASLFPTVSQTHRLFRRSVNLLVDFQPGLYGFSFNTQMCRSSVQHVTKLATAATRQSFNFGSGNVRQMFAAWIQWITAFVIWTGRPAGRKTETTVFRPKLDQNRPKTKYLKP